MKPPALKLGAWEIWTAGERPPDQLQGGMSTGSNYRWIRWEGGPWIQSETPTHRLLRALSYLHPWDYDDPQRDDCPDCGGAWYKMEHADGCPRGLALRLMGNAEPEIREQARVLLDLPEGWDSYGAKRIDPKSAQLAVRVARALYAIADFRMVPMTSGGVALEAHEAGQDVEVTIEPASAEPEMPWWKPRPWGDYGPVAASIEVGDDGTPRIDVFVDSCIRGWFDALWRSDVGAWCWPGSSERVEAATHWRPKGPPPESL